MTIRSSSPTSSTPTSVRSAYRPSRELLRIPRDTIASRVGVQEHVLVPLLREAPPKSTSRATSYASTTAGARSHEILEDKYVQNRLTPEQQRRLLDRPEIIEAFSRRRARVREDLAARARPRSRRRARARARTAAAPERDVPRREPVRLEDDDVLVRLPPRERARDDLVQLVHLEPVEDARLHRLDEVARLELRACSSSRSRRSSRARAPRCRARGASRRSRRPRTTSAPGRSHSPRSTGSRERRDRDDDVLASAASRWLSPASAPTRRQNAASRSGVRQNATTRSMVGNRRADARDLRLGLVAAADDAERACARSARGDVPRRRSPHRSGAARARLPRCTATSSELFESNMQTTKVAPFGVAAYSFPPASPSSASAAAMSASAPSGSLQPSPRGDLDVAVRHPPEARLDRLDGESGATRLRRRRTRSR